MGKEFFKKFIEENQAIIHRICRAYSNSNEEFKDYTQEVALQLWKSHEKFQGNAQISTWVYRVALNVCLSHIRKKKINTSPLLEHDVSYEEEGDEEQLNALYAALKKIKEADRAIILLYLEDKSYKEMAEILGLTVSNVGVKVSRIKIELKSIIHGKR